MTNYNDGKWHGWNGGECPVHPETVVEVVCLFSGDPVKSTSAASNWNWHETLDPVINFRVIKEHRVSREFWANTEDAKLLLPYSEHDDHEEFLDGGYIHVREVLK